MVCVFSGDYMHLVRIMVENILVDSIYSITVFVLKYRRRWYQSIREILVK